MSKAVHQKGGLKPRILLGKVARVMNAASFVDEVSNNSNFLNTVIPELQTLKSLATHCACSTSRHAALRRWRVYVELMCM